MSAFIAVVILCAGPVPMGAQDAPIPPTPAPAPPPTPTPPAAPAGDAWDESAGTQILYREIQTWKEGDARITLFRGGVEVVRQDFRIKADNMVAWYYDKEAAARKAAGRPLTQSEAESEKLGMHEVYAEGHVRIIRPKETLDAEQFFYDFLNDRGTMIEAVFRTREQKHNIPIVVRAEKLRQVDRNVILIEDGNFTTCTFAKPDLSLDVARAEVKRDEAGSGGATIVHIQPKIGSVPILYWPFYIFKLGASSPIENIKIDKSRQFGQTVTASGSIQLTRDQRDESGNKILGKSGKPTPKKWGTLDLNLSWMSLRGWGFGPELDYKWEDYEGFLKTYYIHDKGAPDGTAFLDRFDPIEKDNRGRAWFWHRHKLDDWLEGLRVEAEVGWQSDRNFLEEYFEREFEDDKPKETYLYARYVHDRAAVTLLERYRLNSFQTQTEYLPELAGRLIDQPVFGGAAYYSAQASIGNDRLRIDRDLEPSDDIRLWRFDTTHQLSMPFALGPVRFLPYLSEQFTSWDESLAEDGPLSRWVSSAGMRVNTEFHRDFDVENPSLGLRGVRHIVELEARAADNFHVTRHPDETVPLDEVEQREHLTEIAFEMRHRLQTHEPDGKTIREFLNVGVELEYYPNHVRDTQEAKPQNYLPNFDWIVLAPDHEGVFRRRSASNINFDLTFRPRSTWSLYTDLEYNPYRGKVEVFRADLTWEPFSNMKITLGDRYTEEVTHANIARLFWLVSDKWALNLSTTYDFRNHEAKEFRYGFRRDLHDFYIELFVNVDRGKDDTTFGFTLFPKGLEPKREKF